MPISHTQASYTSIALRIAAGDSSAEAELYQVLVKKVLPWIRFRFKCPDSLDLLHDTYVVTLEALRESRLRNPGHLVWYAITTARYLHNRIRFTCEMPLDLEFGVALQIKQPERPDELLSEVEQREFLSEALGDLGSTHYQYAEVLRRFYLQEQPKETIQREMQLTETQFRLMKSRALHKFGLTGRKLATWPLEIAA